MFRSSVFLLLCVNGAHLAILAHALELDLTVDQSEQGVVAADPDVVAGMDVGASLANQNVAGLAFLASEYLQTQSFALRFTAVLGTTYTFLVCHNLLL